MHFYSDRKDDVKTQHLQTGQFCVSSCDEQPGWNHAVLRLLETILKCFAAGLQKQDAQRFIEAALGLP